MGILSFVVLFLGAAPAHGREVRAGFLVLFCFCGDLDKILLFY